MALTATDLRWYLGGVASQGDPQPDPNDSLGPARSSTELHEIESSLSSAQTSKTRFEDTARIGEGDDTHKDKWVLFLTGANAGHAGRVLSFDSGAGTFVLTEETPSLGSSGDIYQIFSPSNLFDEVSAQESADGDTEYRVLFLRNNGSESVAATARLYMKLLDVARVDWSLANVDPGFNGNNADTGSIATEDEEPPVRSKGLAGGWIEPVDYDSAAGTEHGFTLDPNAMEGIWLRRVVPKLHAGRIRVVLQLVYESPDDTGGDPSPFQTSVLVIFDIVGYTPSLSLERDRRVKIGGGARFTGKVVAAENGEGVPDLEVDWEHTGPGTLDAPGERFLDEDGKDTVLYTAPTDPAKAGQQATITVKH